MEPSPPGSVFTVLFLWDNDLFLVPTPVFCRKANHVETLRQEGVLFRLQLLLFFAWASIRERSQIMDSRTFGTKGTKREQNRGQSWDME